MAKQSEKQLLERLVKVDIALSGRFPIIKGKNNPYTTINSQGQITMPQELRTLYMKRQKIDDFSDSTIFAGPGMNPGIVAVLKEIPHTWEYETFNPLSFGTEGRFVLPFEVDEKIKKIYFQALGDKVEIREYTG